MNLGLVRAEKGDQRRAFVVLNIDNLFLLGAPFVEASGRMALVNPQCIRPRTLMVMFFGVIFP